MTIIKTEFALALNQVATERGISVNEVIASIEVAVLAAYKKEYPREFTEDLKAVIDNKTGGAKILKGKKDVTPPGFGRIAAQTAKQVIIQKIREAEKKHVISHYLTQIGTTVRGRIIRYDGLNAYFDINKAQAILPKDEQIRNERYQINETLILYIKEINNDRFGNPRIVVSRIDPRLVEELFKKEVPEISSGTVKIKKVVRQPGERAKIAVSSSQSGVDAVGACVGQKGVRVQTVTEELGGREKIDVIQWNDDKKIFIISALSPAKIEKIEIDKENKKATVHVAEDQAPLAIGRGGTNVNLASKLAEVEIDIVQNEEPKKTPKKEEKKVEKKDKS